MGLCRWALCRLSLKGQKSEEGVERVPGVHRCLSPALRGRLIKVTEEQQWKASANSAILFS